MDSVAIASIVISLIGAVCMIAYSVPALVKIYKTKDTSSISLVMFIILASGALLFVISTALTMAVTADKADSKAVDIWSPIGVLVGNVFSCSCSIIIAVIKGRNMKNAKKNCMTERQWCDKLLKDKMDKKYQEAVEYRDKASQTPPTNE